MKVSDIMSRPVISVGQQELTSQAARLMKRYDLGALPVCDDRGHLRGVVTDRDIVTRCIAGELDPETTKLREIMTRGITVCSPAEEVAAVMDTMAKNQLRRLPVVEEGKLVGLVSLTDAARSRYGSAEAAEALCRITANVTRK